MKDLGMVQDIPLPLIPEIPQSFFNIEYFWEWLNRYKYINSKNMLSFVKNTLNIEKKLMQKIITKITYFLPEDYQINYRIRFLRFNLNKNTFKCPVCDEPRFFDKSTSKFRNICSSKDSIHHEVNMQIMQKRLKQTCLKKYGVENSMQSFIIKSKAKKTCLEKYGCSNPMQNKTIRERFNKTMLDRYGVDEPSKSKIILQKRNSTLKNNYGIENFGHLFKLKEMRQKRKNTFYQKYGVSHPMKSPLIKKKIKETCLKKYGVENIMQSPKILKKYQEKSFKKYGMSMPFNSEKGVQKRKKVYLTKYGIDNPFKSKDIQQKALKTRYKKYGIKTKDKIRLFHNKNSNILTKKFIQNNFIDNNFNIKILEMMKFYQISHTTCYNYIHAFNIEFRCKDGGFHLDKPAILYYIYDPKEDLYKIGITNNSLEERFGKAFCSKRAIALFEQSYNLGQDAYLAEQEILQTFGYARCNNPSWPEALGGKTEFFKEDILKLNKRNKK